MNVSAVTSAIKKFSGKPLGVASKVIGAVTAASVLYDMFVHGKEKAVSTDRIETGDRAYNNYREYMTMTSESAVTAKAKHFWYDIKSDFSLYHPWQLTKGFVMGAGNRFITALPLIGLSAVALKCKNLGKAAGVLLALHGVKSFIFDVVGLGRKEHIK